jgi:hypothetical protein
VASDESTMLEIQGGVEADLARKSDNDCRTTVHARTATVALEVDGAHVLSA